MPEKYVHRDGLPLLLRHTGQTTLPQDPPAPASAPGGQNAGPDVVCLHDAGLQSSVFADLLTTLEGSGRALAFDMPGHGRSGSLDALPSIEAMAEMACWVADWCRADRPILVGHGMGALVALEWARTRPDSVSGLVLCGAGLALGIEDQAIETMRQVTLGKAPRPFDPSRVAKDSGADFMRRAYMEGIQTDPRATLVDLEASRAWADAFGRAEDAAEITCPTRVVCGAAEHEPCRARAESLASHLANATSDLVEGAAHFLPLEKPAALAGEIRHIAEAL